MSKKPIIPKKNVPVLPNSPKAKKINPKLLRFKGNARGK